MTKFLIPALIVLLTGCEPRLHRAVKSRDYDQVVQYLNAGDNIDINSTSEMSDFFYGGSVGLVVTTPDTQPGGHGFDSDWCPSSGRIPERPMNWL